MTPGSSPSSITVQGARQNNLRDIDVEIPRGRLSVITGVSGSGKSSCRVRAGEWVGYLTAASRRRCRWRRRSEVQLDHAAQI